MDRMVVLFLIFWGNYILLFTVATSIYSPISNVWRFPFSTSSPMSVTSCLFNNVFPCSYHAIHIQLMSCISSNLFQVGSNLNLNSFQIFIFFLFLFPCFTLLMMHFIFILYESITNFCNFHYFHYFCFNLLACFTSDWLNTFIIYLPFQWKFLLLYVFLLLTSTFFSLKKVPLIFLVMLFSGNINSFSFCLSGKLLIFPSILNDKQAR